MNNKGFTLIEVLAVIVILSIIVIVGGRGVSGAIETSKIKSEDVFIKKISSLIDDYLDYVTLNNISFKEDNTSEEIIFDKCYNYNGVGDCRVDGSISVTANLIKKQDGNNITLQDIVDTGLINETDLVNPRVDKKCINLNSTIIYLFKDTDYVYYYFVDLKDSCYIREVDDKNIISTLPNNFCSESEQTDDDGNVIGSSNKTILSNIISSNNVDKICEEG